MSTVKPKRRERIDRNIFKRADGRLELGYRDSTGKQRWKTLPPGSGIMAARAARDEILGAKGQGKRVVPSPRLKFGEAADRWQREQVSELRPQTRASYSNSLCTHLLPRWGRRRLDSIDVGDVARLVRELRAAGAAESSIATVLRAAARIFKFAQRRCGWHGVNPVGALENGERPKTTQTRRRRIFQGGELAQTLAASRQPFRLLFSCAAVTGARLSELLGLTWQDLDLSDTAQATVSFAFQLDRQGQRVELKTDESRRTVELPRSLAALLLEHRARSPHSRPGDFVFATRSGKAVGQRNVLRELRRAMKAAVDAKGRPTFPVLHEDAPVERGSVPNFHSFRHSAASEAIAAGDGAEEVSWQLGHRNSNVTRAIYVQEIKSAERRAKRRDRMEARYGDLISGSAVEAADGNSQPQTETDATAEIVPLQHVRDNRK